MKNRASSPQLSVPAHLSRTANGSTTLSTPQPTEGGSGKATACSERGGWFSTAEQPHATPAAIFKFATVP